MSSVVPATFFPFFLEFFKFLVGISLLNLSIFISLRTQSIAKDWVILANTIIGLIFMFY